MSRSRRSSVDLGAGVVPLSRRSSVDYSADVGQFSRRPSIDYSADVGQFSRRPSIDYSADVGQFSRRQSIDFGAGVGALGLPIRSPNSDSGFSTSVGTNSRRPSVDASAGVGNAVSFCLSNILSECIHSKRRLANTSIRTGQTHIRYALYPIYNVSIYIRHKPFIHDYV